MYARRSMHAPCSLVYRCAERVHMACIFFAHASFTSYLRALICKNGGADEIRCTAKKLRTKGCTLPTTHQAHVLSWHRVYVLCTHANQVHPSVEGLAPAGSALVVPLVLLFSVSFSCGLTWRRSARCLRPIQSAQHMSYKHSIPQAVDSKP